MIKQGAITIEGKKVLDENITIDLSRPSIIKVGKRNFLKIKPE
jgi:tyrosyl-tRNA synthetase